MACYDLILLSLSMLAASATAQTTSPSISSSTFATQTSTIGTANSVGSSTASTGDGTCEQPYNEHEEKLEGSYIVNFTVPYSLDEHFAFLDETFDVTELDSGYFAFLTDDQLNKVRSDCQVEAVEDDVVGPTHDEDFEFFEDEDPNASRVRRGLQKDAPWPLELLSSNTKSPSKLEYQYVDEPGKGVDLYIVDSGINHNDEFNDDDDKDRVIDELNQSTDPDFGDSAPNYGHGTPAASVAGGNRYGVAKSVTLRNVKAEYQGKPNAGRFVLAMQHIRRYHGVRKSTDEFKGSIVNMSFRMAKTNAVAQELTKAHEAGISLVASAGNYLRNPSQFPCTEDKVICVGATNNKYEPWIDNKQQGVGSNYGGDVVNIWAPGQSVPALSKSGSEAFATGTSFAAPYVSGILALFYGVEGKDLTPDKARERLFKQASDWMDFRTDRGIDDWLDSPNTFANTGYQKGQALTPKRPYLDGPEQSGTCFADVGMKVVQTDDSNSVGVSVALLDENKEEVNSWEGDMEVEDTQSMGGLGEDVEWKLVSHTGPEGANDIEFSQGDSVTFNWLECEEVSEEPLEDLSGYEAKRQCSFACG